MMRMKTGKGGKVLSYIGRVSDDRHGTPSLNQVQFVREEELYES
jgi:hypothetical protein